MACKPQQDDLRQRFNVLLTYNQENALTSNCKAGHVF